MTKPRSKKSHTAPRRARQKPEPQPGGNGGDVIFVECPPENRIEEVVESQFRDAGNKPLITVWRNARIFIRAEPVATDPAVARRLTLFLYSIARRPNVGHPYNILPGKGGKGFRGGADGQDGAIRFRNRQGREMLAFAKGVAFVRGKPASNTTAYKALVEWLNLSFAPTEF